MRFSSIVVALMSAVLAGCAARSPASLGGPANLIIVRQFAFSPGVVTLDPSLGFSLYRGSPGAPPRERAAAVGRAAAFSLADAIAAELRRLGYDAIDADEAAAGPSGRALIVTGTFRRIFEGHRHTNASVAVAVAVDALAGGSVQQRLTAFDLDSRTVPRQPVSASAERGGGVNLAADRVAATIAGYVADLARLNRWPAAR